MAPRARRLAWVPEPHEGEAFAGWVTRVASALEVTTLECLRSLGVLGQDERIMAGYGVVLSDAQMVNLSAASGLLPERLAPTLLSSLAGRAIPEVDFSSDLARSALEAAVVFRVC